MSNKHIAVFVITVWSTCTPKRSRFLSSHGGQLLGSGLQC